MKTFFNKLARVFNKINQLPVPALIGMALIGIALIAALLGYYSFRAGPETGRPGYEGAYITEGSSFAAETSEAKAQGLTLDEITQSTGTICMDNGQKGSGFVISGDGLVATCFHVIADRGLDANITGGDFYLHYGTENEEKYEIERVVGYSEAKDIAILKTSAVGVTPIPLGDSDSLMIGDDVRIIGTPAGNKANANSVITASVSKIHTTEYGMKEIQLSAGGGAVGGVSGGPVMKSMDGTDKYQAVAIYSATYTEANVQKAIPITLIPADFSVFSVDSGDSIEDINRNRQFYSNSNYSDMGERFDLQNRTR
jgi:S1-C subfamily serine protease